MDAKKKERLTARGWKIGSPEELLQLSPDEAAYIEIRLALAVHLRELRQQNELTQLQLARKISSSQSRVAKMERGDPSVSLDLLIRSLLALGASRSDLAARIRVA